MSEKWTEAQRRIARALLTGEPAKVAGPWVLARESALGREWVRCGTGSQAIAAVHMTRGNEYIDSESEWTVKSGCREVSGRRDTEDGAKARADAILLAAGYLLLNAEDIPAELRETP